MRKQICLLIALTVIFGLYACGGAKVEKRGNAVAVTVTAQEPIPTPAPTAELTLEPVPAPEPPFAEKEGFVFAALHGFDGLL